MDIIRRYACGQRAQQGRFRRLQVQVGTIKGKKGASLTIRLEEMPGDWEEFAPGGRHPVHVEGRLVNTGAAYYLDAVAETTVELACDRCLKPLQHALRTDVRQAFADRPPSAAAEDDDEVLPVTDDRIDLWPAVRSHLLLALPMKVLCRPDCRGLCPQCGQDINDGPCACPPPSDPRLEVLRRLLEH